VLEYFKRQTLKLQCRLSKQNIIFYWCIETLLSTVWNMVIAFLVLIN